MSEGMRTKKALGRALMYLCVEKQFNKINVVDVTESCGLSRQTFYYHFSDKYALLEWVYDQHALHYLFEAITLDNWQEQVYFMLKKMKQEPKFYMRTVREDPTVLERRFGELTQELFLILFDKEKVTSICSQDRLFYAEFFSYGCCGVLLKWIRGGMNESAWTITEQLAKLAHDASFIIQKLEEKHGDPTVYFSDLSKN